MRQEARNLERFHQDFQDDPRLVFPRPVHPWVTDSILVEDFEVKSHDLTQASINTRAYCFFRSVIAS